MPEESGRAITQDASVDDSLTFGEADPTITSLEDVHLDSTLVLVGCGASKRDPDDPADLHLASVPEGEEIPGHGTGPAWRAEDLYTSTYFAVKREFAEVVTAWANSRDATPWAVLSAEHGILPHWQDVPRYDTTIEDLGDDPENPDYHVDSSIVRRRPDGREIVTEMDLWATNVAYGLARWLSGYRERGDAALTSRVNSLLVLAGQDYIQPLKERGVFRYGISRMAGNPNENLAQLDADVRFLFEEIDADGIGEQMGWLSDTVDTLEPLVNDIEETEQDTLVTDGGQPAESGRGDNHLTAVDLFCGGGGFSTGLALACEDLGHDIRLVAVNHDTDAVETHRRNHPWAEQYNAKVEELHPPNIIGDDDVDLLVAGPECTHFSSARGGKPVNEQRRASPWHVVDWVQKTQPGALLVENVPELKSWGPIDEDGQPTRNGETFQAWIDALCSLGYSMDWDVLNAADYGDATTRRRLFVVGRRDRRAAHPEPTHAENPDGDREPWRPASEIIDWTDRGSSIWRRSRPLSEKTMLRIAQGIREHCDDRLAEFADVVESITPADVEAMQEDVVAASDLEAATEARDEPFLVEGPATVAADVEAARGLSVPMVMGQQSNAKALDAQESPLPTVATRGAIHYIEAEAFVKPRNGPQRGPHSNPTYEGEDRPLHTVTAKNHDGHLVSPFLVEYYGNSDTASVEEPLPTVTTKDRHALCVPDLYPWGLDLRYRMLQPRELAAAQGFPEDYEFAGSTKKSRTAQIGNAVPVNLGKALVKKVLTGEEASLSTYTPEVASDD